MSSHSGTLSAKEEVDATDGAHGHNDDDDVVLITSESRRNMGLTTNAHGIGGDRNDKCHIGAEWDVDQVIVM